MGTVATQNRPLAMVTGASTGIGYELARCCVANGHDLVIAADEAAINDAAMKLASEGGGGDARVLPVEADLSTHDGCDQLIAAAGGRPVSILIANAGRGLGRAFIEQDWNGIQRVIDTNVTGTLYLIHKVVPEMKSRGEGKVLITGSIAGLMPGTYQAVYNGTKALLDSFSYALRAELKDTGVTVTCLMPGATETEFFERADLMDTKVGTQKKDSPTDVARAGWEALMKGEGEVVTGWSNKLRAAISHIVPQGMLAEQHRKMAQPGTAKH